MFRIRQDAFLKHHVVIVGKYHQKRIVLETQDRRPYITEILLDSKDPFLRRVARLSSIYQMDPSSHSWYYRSVLQDLALEIQLLWFQSEKGKVPPDIRIILDLIYDQPISVFMTILHSKKVVRSLRPKVRVAILSTQTKIAIYLHQQSCNLKYDQRDLDILLTYDWSGKGTFLNRLIREVVHSIKTKKNVWMHIMNDRARFHMLPLEVNNCLSLLIRILNDPEVNDLSFYRYVLPRTLSRSALYATDIIVNEIRTRSKKS